MSARCPHPNLGDGAMMGVANLTQEDLDDGSPQNFAPIRTKRSGRGARVDQNLDPEVLKEMWR